MKYSKILLFMMALVCLAFQACAQLDPLGESSSSSTMGSSEDYLSPPMGQKYPQDGLEGGYVGSSDRSQADPGIDGMVQWLDQPVPADVTESTTTATGTTPSPDADATKSTTTTTDTTPSSEPTSKTESTTTSSTTPGFEATIAVAGLLVVTFIALRRRH